MSAPDDAPKSALGILLALRAVTYVAQIGRGTMLPLPLADSPHGICGRDAKRGVTVEGRDAELRFHSKINSDGLPLRDAVPC